MSLAYPRSAAERTRWIVERRSARNPVEPGRPYAFLLEQERSAAGQIENVATVFLTNRECPWHCVMCDLWRNTTESAVTPEQVLQQIRFALAQLGPATVLKLYNSGSFFDPGAIPRTAWREIAALCRSFNHLIVECHPRLIGTPVLEFLSLLPCTLEVAVGLETAHPRAHEALNKRTTIDDFRSAATFLKRHDIALRTFLLVHPPFVPARERESALRESIEFAFECGSDVVSLIPLRPGNGAIETLLHTGEAQLPSLRELEEAQELALAMNRGRAFADTWDLDKFSPCAHCRESRVARLTRINLSQSLEPRSPCPVCRDE